MNIIHSFFIISTALDVTEGKFAVLYVSNMGLTHFYKTTVFLHLYLQFFCWMLKICSVAQNQFQQRKTKDRHIYWNNSTSLLSFTFHSSMKSQFASARERNCVTVSRFVEIGQTAAEIWQFFDFSKMAAIHHLGFVTWVIGPPTKGVWWSITVQN